VVLMDDPLSAVDPGVGQHLFQQCVAGPLMAGRTRLLVTHQTQFLPRCRRVLTLLPNSEPAWADGAAFEVQTAACPAQ
jgi:ABC-type nitrate/sulfonate/bicarbonate transport system ATPase subunit